MNDFMIKAQKNRIKEQRQSKVRKRIFAIIEIILFTFLFIAAVYLFLDYTQVKAFMVERYTIKEVNTYL